MPLGLDILHAMPLPAVLLAEDGRLLAANPAWDKLAWTFGVTPADRAAGPDYAAFCECHGLLPPDTALAVKQGMRAVQSGEVLDFSLDYACQPEGGPRWFRLRLARLFPEVAPCSPGPPALLALHEDISKQKEAEQRLEQADRLFGIVGRMAAIGGWIVDLDSRWVEWSREVGELHGLPEVRGLPLDKAIEYYAPESRGLVRDRFEACASQGIPYDEEVEILPAGAGRLWVRTVGVAVRDAGGRIVRIQGTFQDVSERRRAEAALSQSEQRFRRFADALPHAVWTASPEGRADFFNRAFAERFAGGAIDPSRWAWSTVLPADQTAKWARNWRRALDRSDIQSDTLRLRLADGRERWHLVTAAPVRDEAGVIVKWYGTAIDDHDRKLAEEEIRRLASRLDMTLNSIDEAFYTVDRSWHITYLNDQAEAMTGLPRVELLGRELWEAFPASIGTRPYTEYHRAMAERRPVRFDYFSALLNLWLDVSAYPMDEGLAIHLRDISERRVAMEELRRSEARFRAVARATSAVVWEMDLTTGRIWWNSDSGMVFGYPVEELGPDLETWRSRIHPADRARVAASSRAAIAERQPFWREQYRFVHRDGSIIDVEDRGYLILEGDGLPTRFVGGLADVTDTARIQARLRQQAALLEEAQDAIFVLDMDGRVEFWNRGAERLYGLGAAQVLTTSVGEILGGEGPKVGQAIAILRSEGQWQGSMAHIDASGRPLAVEAKWTLVRDERGEPRSILAIHTDVTARRALEEQLRQSQRLETVGQLTGGIAHDFNNLLTVILGNAELMLDELGTNPRLARLAITTRIAAQRGAELTGRLLAFARRQPLDPKPVDIDRLLAGMDELLRPALGGDVEIALVRTAELWPAMIDAHQLENAVLNLCVNARDAMSGGGRLTIETANVRLGPDYAGEQAELAPGDYVLVAVSDTGGGMSAEVAAKAFDPFFTTKEAGKGTGLGLSMVYGFIKQSGGHVKIYSEVGAGTTVKLYLPRATSEPSVPVPGLDEAQPATGSETILVVEDDGLVRHHVTDLLAGLGYRVLTADSGETALEVLRGGEEVDLMFTDVVMPGGMNGRELAERARALRPDLPILFTSGYARNAIVHHGRLDPGVHLLVKPYRRQELAAKVRQVLQLGGGQDR